MALGAVTFQGYFLLDLSRIDGSNLFMPGKTERKTAAAPKARKPRRHERPSDFTETIAQEICERIALGEPVRQIALLAQMPDERTIYRWLLKHSAFREMYARAKEAQADRLAEEVLEIADDATNDWIERQNERTGKTSIVHDTEAVQRSKLRIATRQWLIERYRPGKGEDKVTVEHSGEVKSTVTVLTEERRKLLAEKKRSAVLRRMGVPSPGGAAEAAKGTSRAERSETPRVPRGQTRN